MDQLQVYATAELLLSIHISVSNLLVLWVYVRNRSVRTVTNTYIFSLALTDFFVGAIGIPVTVFSVLTRWPYEYMSCLTVHLILCILCTISTFHMLAIALDKYVTICCRDRVFQTRHSRAVFLIASSWLFGTLIACLPLFGAFNFQNTSSLFSGECHFTNVVDYRYLVYVIFFATILAPTAVIIFCYASIYRRIRQDESQVKCLLRQSEREKRMLGRRKLIRILLILVFTYAVCWYPLYIINTIDFFVPQWSIARFTLLTVVVSHFSCALNPLIYAYGMPGYKKALRNIFSRRAMDHMNTTCNYSGYVRSSVPKQNRSFTLRGHEALGLPLPPNIRKASAPGPYPSHLHAHHSHSNHLASHLLPHPHHRSDPNNALPPYPPPRGNSPHRPPPIGLVARRQTIDVV